MGSVNDAILNRGIRHAVYLDQLATGEVDRMVRFMDRELFPDVKRILDRRLGRIASTGFERGVHTTARYKQMMKMLDAQISGAMKFMSNDAVARLTRIAANEAQWAQAMLKDTVPLSIGFNQPSMQIIRSIVTAKPFQGQHLKGWYSDLGKGLQSNIRKQVNIGLASGESVPKISARIMGVRGAETGFTGASTRAVMRRQVRAIVRTSTNHVANNAREAMFKENQDLISKVRWVSALDARTSDICQSLDGQEWKVGEGQRPPAHHQCRSTVVPITKSWKELGIKNAKDVRVGGRVFRDVQTGLTGVSPTHITYGDWLIKQPAEVQNQIFGVQRAQMLRSGQVKFPQFFSDTGRRLGITELAELEGVEAVQ